MEGSKIEKESMKPKARFLISFSHRIRDNVEVIRASLRQDDYHHAMAVMAAMAAGGFMGSQGDCSCAYVDTKESPNR